MKLTKIIAGIAASALATSTMVVAASATLQKAPAPDAGLSSGTGGWLVQLYNVGNEAEGKPATDYGIDYSKVAGIAITVTIPEVDSFGTDNRLLWDGTIAAVYRECNGTADCKETISTKTKKSRRIICGLLIKLY